MALIDNLQCDECKKMFKERQGLWIAVYISKHNECPHGVKTAKPINIFKLSTEERHKIELKYNIACDGTKKHYFRKSNQRCIYCMKTQKQYMDGMATARYKESTFY